MNFFKDKVTIQTCKLGIFFFIMFTAFLSFQNIVTHVYEQQGLSGVGPLNLIVNYLSFLISNTFAVKCKYSFKSQLLVGSLAYGVNMCTGIFVPYIQNKTLIYLIVAAGGITGGISGGFLWVSQGGYLRQICSHKLNKGKYNGIFSFFLSFSSLTAGITTTFFLGYFSNQVYFIALTTLMLTATLYGGMFLQNLSQASQSGENQSLISVDNNIHVQHITESSNLKDQHQYNNPRLNTSNSADIHKSSLNEKQDSVMSNVINSLKFYKKMKLVLIFLILDGFLLGIQSNQMNKLIPDEIKQNQQDFRLKAGILTIFIGFGSMVGSYVSAPISDIFGLNFSGKTTLFTYVITCVLTFAASLNKMYWLACSTSFLWGFSYYLFEGWIFVSILKLFKGKLQAFAINKQTHCISMAGFQIIVIFTANKFDIKWLMIGIIGLVIPAIWCLLRIDYSNDAYGDKLKKQNQKLLQ